MTHTQDTIAQTVLDRIAKDEPQIIHIPWPAELGEYGVTPKDPDADAKLDAWVEAKVAPLLPAKANIIGICAGRAYRGNDLMPCAIITVAARTSVDRTIQLHGVRRTWADGQGGVR